MKSCVLLFVALLVAAVASAQTSGVSPLPVGQTTAQEISDVRGGVEKFEKAVVWKLDGVAFRADAEETARYEATPESGSSLPTSLRDSAAHVRYEPLAAVKGQRRQNSGQQSASSPVQSGRQFLAAVLGAVGGFIGGAYLGSHISTGNGGSEDPGAPAAILCGAGGAVLGAVIGYKLF